MTTQQDSIDVHVQTISIAATDVYTFELRNANGLELPSFEAGAHVELRMPGGLIRQYSLLNAPGERQRYVIAVHRDPASRGGSKFMHETLRVGDRLKISIPRNNFRLDEGLHRTILVAGGIGITPLLSMIKRLEQLGREWILHYASRTRRHAAFLESVQRYESILPGRVRLHFDDEHEGRFLDIESAVRAGGRNAHFYCCGPSPMLSSFARATATLPTGQVHVEYFKSAPGALWQSAISHQQGTSFSVELQKSGKTLRVPAGKSILDIALDAGIDVPFSCGEGFCGTCMVRVIEGTPDHRDTVLDGVERERGDVMMICCSRAVGDHLVIDL